MNRLETSLPIDVMIATAVVTLIVFCCKMSMSKVVQVCPMSDDGIWQRAIWWLENTSSNFDEAQKSGKYQIWTFWIATSFILNSLSSSAFCNEHLSPPRLTPLPKISWPWQNLFTVTRALSTSSYVTIWDWHIFQLRFLFAVNIFLQHVLNEKCLNLL